MVPGSIDPRLERVADEPCHQPAKGDVLLLGDFAEVAEKFIGQDDVNVGIGVHRHAPVDQQGAVR